MIVATAIVGTLVVLVAFASVGWSIKTNVRRHRRFDRVMAQRFARAPEDLCWRYCRDDAYSDALFIALRRNLENDGRLLRDLGVAIDRIADPSPLEVAG